MFLFICVALFASQLHAATATLALPLQGHYHPGRYMPVRVSAQLDAGDNTFTLAGGGAMTTEVPGAGGRIDAVIPWLAVQTIRDTSWSNAGSAHPVELPLHALDSEDRLIGYAGADPDALAATFSGRKLYRVPLDVTDPLPGDISAWEALDGIVLDGSVAPKVTEGQLRALLAGGTAVAIRAPGRPGDAWPWQQQGAYWIAKVDIAGPMSAYKPDAYAPTQTWLRGWPMIVRREILLAGIVLVILITAISLWRSRWMVAAAVIFCAIATALAFAWRARQPPAIAIGGSIILRTDSTTQRDTWTYRAALREMDDAVELPPLTHPVLGYRAQVREMAIRLGCSSHGQPVRIAYHIKPGQSLAFQTRSLAPSRETLAPKPAENTSLRTMADELYAMKNDRIVGEIGAATDERWADVVIDSGGSRR